MSDEISHFTMNQGESQPTPEVVVEPDVPAAADSDQPSIKRFILDAIETVAIALVIFFVVYYFVAQPHLVKGESMMPNYFDGEYILTSRVYNWFSDPQRGDVIVLVSPDDPSIQFIKRIIALPGEKIELKDGQVIIYNKTHPDGWVLPEHYLPDDLYTRGGAFLEDSQIVQVPGDDYVVMGDNRSASYDSRSWGLLPKSKIVGKAFFVYWPLKSFGFVAHADYSK